jgi:hypothetical protein
MLGARFLYLFPQLLRQSLLRLCRDPVRGQAMTSQYLANHCIGYRYEASG